MNIRTSLRREDLALVRAWGRSVYADRARVDAVHSTDSGWLAEDAAGRIVGTFGREQRARFCSPRRGCEALMSERPSVAIPKNSREEIRISRDIFRDHDLVSIRIWFKADDGSMRPSKDGVAFRVALIDEIIEALQAAKDAEP